MDAVTLALSASALVALGAGLLSAWLLLSLGDLVARARLLYRPRWRRTLDSLLRHEDEETPDETPRQRNVLAMLPGLAGILLAILVRDWLLSLYLVTLGLSLIWLMRSRQGRKEQAKLTDQVKMLVVLFRSHFAVGGSPFSVLSEVEPELPAGRLRAAVRRTVDIYHTTGKVKEALNAMRKLDNPYLARLVMVMEAASVSSTEVVLDELKRLEGDLKARDRLRAQAKASLASAQLKLDDLLAWTPDENAVALAQANLDAAQADYARIAARAEHTDDQLASARVNLEKAQTTLSDSQDAYDTAWDPGRDWELGDPKRVTKLENEREAAQRNLERAQLDLEVAQANYNLAVLEIDDSNLQNAWAKVVSARKNLEDAQTGPDESDIEAARIQVRQAELALAQAQLNLEAAQSNLEDWDTTTAELSLSQAQLKLETAQRNLEETILLAPLSGTVMAVGAQVGESVSASPIITLANMEEPQVLFWVEESDLMSVAPGNAVNIVFEALPDYTFPGEIVSIDPALVTVDGTAAVQSWASVDLSAHPVSLLSGMNADVEIVAGEALNALLVPVQALRELGPDQYAVFVVGANGELELRPVEVGLQDFVNVEIISGLKAGEVVSVGTATSSATSTESSTDSEQPPPGIMRFLGGG